MSCVVFVCLYTIEWDIHYAALLTYYNKYGTCKVPFKEDYACKLEGLGENGSVYEYVGKLGRWLGTQRQAKKGHKLKPERRAKLQKLVDEGKCVFNSCYHIELYECQN